MTLRAVARRILRQLAANEDLNFLLTNRLPRRLATRFIGWLSRIEQPLVRDLSIWTWRQFTDLDLSDASTTHFTSLHACFTRKLKPGARPIDADPGILVSPCDAIVGAHGALAGTRLFQIKGMSYELVDLIGDADLASVFHGGTFVTLRLTSAMYHRFHAPCACQIREVRYIWGDTWNVNPIALKRVEGLFCRNERAALRLTLDASGATVLLVPVAAILVAGLRLPFLATDLRIGGTRTIPCDKHFRKGEEIGWFEHGSTIVVLAPVGIALSDELSQGRRIRRGKPLMRLPPASRLDRFPG